MTYSIKRICLDEISVDIIFNFVEQYIRWSVPCDLSSDRIRSIIRRYLKTHMDKCTLIHYENLQELTEETMRVYSNVIHDVIEYAKELCKDKNKWGNKSPSSSPQRRRQYFDERVHYPRKDLSNDEYMHYERSPYRNRVQYH